MLHVFLENSFAESLAKIVILDQNMISERVMLRLVSSHFLKLNRPRSGLSSNAVQMRTTKDDFMFSDLELPTVSFLYRVSQ